MHSNSMTRIFVLRKNKHGEGCVEEEKGKGLGRHPGHSCLIVWCKLEGITPVRVESSRLGVETFK